MAAAKLERLLNLIAELLHAERPITAEELHRRIPGYPDDKDSFKRSFERDKKDLREMHIPLRIEPVPGRMPAEDGYRIDQDEYGLPDPGLEPDELAAIHLAANAVRLDGIDATTGLQKLGGATGEAGDGGAVLPSSPHLPLVFEAVGQQRSLRFRYRDKDRHVDPFRLHHERGRWYVQGHDHGAGEARSFRLDRIEGEVDLDEPGSATVTHVASTPLRLDAWALGEDEPVSARVRIRPPQAAIAVRSVGPHVPAVWEDDGSVVLQLEVRRRDGFRSFVLGFLDDAEVIEPEELRHDLIVWLAAIADGGSGLMARVGATERLGRILAMVPWIASQEAGASIDEVCQRFGIEPDQLAADLDVVFLVGLYPYTPDSLIEVDLDEESVAIRYTNFFERPLRLSRDEGLALLAAGLSARSQPGHDPDGPLERGLQKLAGVLDIDLDDDLEVVVPEATQALHAAVDRAIVERRVLHLSYFSHARNEQTERDIEPRRLFTSDGAWYVDAFCRASDDARVFRLDRITDLATTDEHFDAPEAGATTAAVGIDLGDDLPQVELDLSPEARWVVDQYPVVVVDQLADGWQRVGLPVSARPWLERLLLRLGPDARVVAIPVELGGAGVGAEAAERLLHHHRR